MQVGPTNRDWCSPLFSGQNGSCKLLAEALARQNFVTMRYDKLGSGPHAQVSVSKLIGKISMQSHVDELAGAIKTLVKETNIDKEKLFVLTNSEGAIHALNYQLKSKIKFKGLIFTGPPGRSVAQVARNQIMNQIESIPNNESILKKYDEAINSILKGNPINTDDNLPEIIKQLLMSLANPANLPFVRELWAYNTSTTIPKVKEPILVLIGKKDIQVDWRADGGALEAAVDKNLVSFIYPKTADHVLKYEENARKKLGPETITRYNAHDRELDQEAIDVIFSWINMQLQNIDK